MTEKEIVDEAAKINPRFAKWLAFELSWEVEKQGDQIVTEDVAGDSGGRTFAGIDEASHPDFPYDKPTPARVAQEWLKDWEAADTMHIPAPLGEVYANYVVNMGRVPSTRLLQQVLDVTMDGRFGPKTLHAANIADPLKAALALVHVADLRYEHLANMNVRLKKFLAGWLNRNGSLAEFATDEFKPA